MLEQDDVDNVFVASQSRNVSSIAVNLVKTYRHGEDVVPLEIQLLRAAPLLPLTKAIAGNATQRQRVVAR